jgi:predicted negative regulator of RcsB-dependent stress response
MKNKLQQEVQQNVEKVKEFKNNNKKLLLVAGILLLGFLLWGTFSNKYHKKEIKALEKEIELVQEKFEEAVIEKERLRDSSEVYETIAAQAELEADKFRDRAVREKKDKETALAALKNLPKDEIDTFLAKRYVNVEKADVNLDLDKNVGNAIVVELVEKDHLVGQLATSDSLNTTLTGQVSSLKTSLDFSKSALISADSAIAHKTKQFELQQQVSDLLKKDLKTAKNKAFWNKFKGAGVGLLIGFGVGILAK